VCSFYPDWFSTDDVTIRANANTVINENKPSDAAEVLAYYNREQYGVNPLFYGPQYTEAFAGLDKENPRQSA
jgi:hypothetical protein